MDICIKILSIIGVIIFYVYLGIKLSEFIRHNKQ